MKILQVIALIIIIMTPVSVSTYVMLNDDNKQEIFVSDIQEEEETDTECFEAFQLLEYLNDRDEMERQLKHAAHTSTNTFKKEAQIFEEIKPETITPPPRIS